MKIRGGVGTLGTSRLARSRAPIAFIALLGFVNLSIVVAFAQDASLRSRQRAEVGLAAPQGLHPCASHDSVASIEARLAPRLGAEYMGCFSSKETTMLHGGHASTSVPVEYAIALRVSGGPFSPADVDSFLSKVREEWKNFEPLSQEHREYVARLNAMIRDSDPKAGQASLKAIKPALISIERLAPHGYLVLSVRHYITVGTAGTVTSTKADATAMVLQGTRLIRLTILREVRAPSDVDIARKDIVAWAHDVSAEDGNPAHLH